MAESTLWQYLRKNAQGHGHWVRIENTVGNGTPDVNGCFMFGNTEVDVWIELKALKAWPVRPTTLIRIKHFTSDQKQWLLDRKAAGGRAFLFVRVMREYFLFSAVHAQIIEKLTRAQWEEVALLHYKNRVNWEHFRRVLACH